MPDKTINEKILDDFPIPDNVNLTVPKIDNYVPDNFSENILWQTL